jgi:hypothetical protein
MIEKISTARAWVGFVITVWMCWPYLGFGFLQDFFGDVARTVSIAGIVAVAVLAGGFFLHASGDRKHYLRGAVFPFGRVVVGIGIIELATWLLKLRLSFIGTLISLAVAIWLIPFLACAFWQVGKVLFGTSDAHPILGPATTALTLTVALVYKLGFGTSALPAGVSLTIDVVGYLTAVGLCGYEIMRVFAIQRVMTERKLDVEQARRTLSSDLREWWWSPSLRIDQLGRSLWAAFRGSAPATGRQQARPAPGSVGGEAAAVDEDNTG